MGRAIGRPQRKQAQVIATHLYIHTRGASPSVDVTRTTLIKFYITFRPSVLAMVHVVRHVVQYGQGDPHPVPVPRHLDLCSVWLRCGLLSTVHGSCSSAHKASATNACDHMEYSPHGCVSGRRSHFFECCNSPSAREHSAYDQGRLTYR